MNNLSEALVYVGFALAPAIVIYALYAYRTHHREAGTLRLPSTIFIGNILVLLLLLSLAALALETHLRFFADFTDSYAMSRLTMRWHDRHAHYNSIGSRDNMEYELKKKPGQRRITFLGDSFTAGHGIADVEDRFVNLVRAERPDWEVHTISRNSQDTGDEIKRIKIAGDIGYDLDVVVLVYCMNDISDLMPEWQETWNRMHEKFKETGFLTTHSMLFNTLYYRLHAVRDRDVMNYFPSVKKAYEDERWEEQKRRLATLAEKVRDQGAELLVVTFPLMHALDEDYSFAEVHANLAAVWKDLDVPHLDLLPLYKGLSRSELTVNPFDAHPSILAHKLAADAMEVFIASYLETAAPPAAVESSL